MANNSISSLTRGMAGNIGSGVSQVRGGAESSAARAPVSAASAAKGSGSSTGGGGTASRQVINVDGQNLNPNARRGTYLNIVI